MIQRETLDNFSDKEEEPNLNNSNKEEKKSMKSNNSSTKHNLFNFNDDNKDNKDDSDNDSENKDFIPNIKELKKKGTNKSKNSFNSENQESDKSSNKNNDSLKSSDKSKQYKDQNNIFYSKNSQKTHTSNSEDDSEHKDKFGIDDEDSFEKQRLPEFTSLEEVEEFFKELRIKFKQKEKEGLTEEENLWSDPEFEGEISLFYRDGEMPKRFADSEIEFHRPSNSTDQGDSQKIEFFSTDTSNNINYQFKVRKGMVYDKSFVGCILMLFKSREEFFNNLVIDLEHVNENIKYGFCGFQFFINGEWKYVVIDTYIPQQQTDDLVLSSATSVKSSFWLPLICKAYSKVFNSYDVLNDINVSIKNVLVDLTGGTSKKISVSSNIDDYEKKNLFEELKRHVHQGYLVGCMKYEEVDEEDLDDSQSDNGEDEDILENSMYVFLDIQEVDGLKMIYLNNSWGKGKWSGQYSPEDENWETNKGLKEKLGYENQNDGTFWMLYEQWLQQFNTVYSCRIYPSSWHQFCIPGNWTGITSGGAPIENDDENSIIKNKATNARALTNKQSIISNNVDNKKSSVFGQSGLNGSASKQGMNSLMKNNNSKQSFLDLKNNTKNTVFSNSNQTNQEGNIKSVNENQVEKPKAEIKYRETIKRVILQESDDRWFLNPQYKIELKPKSKLIISLMQEDEKLSLNPYEPVNFLIMLSSGKYSRVWDIKDENIVKRAVVNTTDQEPCREIICQLNYFEVLQKLAEKRKKKVITKYESIFINLIPYQEYKIKYDIEKTNQLRNFKQFSQDGVYWLRIFSSESIGILELPQSYEKTIEYKFSDTTYGGSRFLPESTAERLIENQYWPLNPQFLLKFELGTSLKVIARKTTCIGNTNEESKIGLILTKPDLGEYNTVPIKSLKATGNYKKNDNILRVLESSNKILETKKLNFEEIGKKLFFNLSEWVVESPYKSCYSASLFQTFNKIDSPILVIPTLENYKDTSEFTLSSKLII